MLKCVMTQCVAELLCDVRNALRPETMIGQFGQQEQLGDRLEVEFSGFILWGKIAPPQVAQRHGT